MFKITESFDKILIKLKCMKSIIDYTLEKNLISIVYVGWIFKNQTYR